MIRNNIKYGAYLIVAAYISNAHAGPKEDFFRAVANDADYAVADLLKAGFDPNTTAEDGQLGLTQAVRDNSAKVTAVLLAEPRTEIDGANRNGETPLMMAALRGNLALARDLLARGAHVNRDGWTPLHYAATGESTEMVVLLLDKGAVVDARSPNGTTALMMAARYGAIDSADLLVQRGADRSLKNQRGLTAADFAASIEREALAARLRPQ